MVTLKIRKNYFGDFKGIWFRSCFSDERYRNGKQSGQKRKSSSRAMPPLLPGSFILKKAKATGAAKMSAKREAVACPSEEGATIHHLSVVCCALRGRLRCCYDWHRGGVFASCILRKADDLSPLQSTQGTLRFPCVGCRPLPHYKLAQQNCLVLQAVFFHKF